METISRPAPGKKVARTRKAKASRKVKPIESVRRELELMKPRLALALPPHLTADRLMRMVLAVLQSTPALLECDRASLYRTVMTCAQLGLEPDGVLGLAYLVPFRDKVQLVPGYCGLIALARNSGEVISIQAQAVHRNDRFEFAYGLNERLEHVPAEGPRGEITHFYAYVRFKDGGYHFDVMSRAEVDAVRDRSESYAEVGKKAVLRRIARFLPPAVQKAAALSDLYESGRYAVLDDLGVIVVDLPEPVQPGPAEGIDLGDKELAGLFPPPHILRILDAVAEREMPEEELAAIVGKPLDEVTEEDEAEILRAIGEWRVG